MNTARRIAKNTIAMLVAQLLSMGLGFFNIVLTARYLGATEFGVLAFALAFTGVFGILTDVGLNIMTTREVARNKQLASKYLGNVAIVKIGLVSLTLVLVISIASLIGYSPRTLKIVAILSLSIASTTFTGMFNSIFQAFERMEYQSVGAILSSTMTLVGTVFVIRQGYDIVGFSLAILVSSVVVTGYASVVCTRKFAIPRIEIDVVFLKRLLKNALPFGLTGVFITLYYWMATLMLSYIKGDLAVGYYNAAYRLVLMCLFIHTAYVSAVFPTMARYHRVSTQSLKLLYEKSLKLMIMIATPIVLLGNLLADRIILLIYGPEYSQSIQALQILMWALLFMFIGGIAGNLLSSIDRQSVVTRIVFLAAILNICLNLTLITFFGILGACVASVLTEFAVSAMIFYALSNTGYSLRVEFLRFGIGVGVGGIVIVLVVHVLAGANLGLIVLLGLIAYSAALVFAKAFDKDDVQMISNLVHGRMDSE